MVIIIRKFYYLLLMFPLDVFAQASRGRGVYPDEGGGKLWAYFLIIFWTFIFLAQLYNHFLEWFKEQFLPKTLPTFFSSTLPNFIKSGVFRFIMLFLILQTVVIGVVYISATYF